jgi:hypothetical protein
MQRDRQRLILDRTQVIPEVLPGQPAELLECGRELVPGQQVIAGPDHVIVVLQASVQLEAEPERIDVIGVDLQSRRARRQCVFLAGLLIQQPGPAGVVQSQVRAVRGLEPDGLFQVGQRAGPLGGGRFRAAQVRGGPGAVERSPVGPQVEGSGELLDRLLGLVLL